MSECRYPPAHNIGDFRNCGCKEERSKMNNFDAELLTCDDCAVSGSRRTGRCSHCEPLFDAKCEAVRKLNEQDGSPYGRSHRGRYVDFHDEIAEATRWEWSRK